MTAQTDRTAILGAGKMGEALLAGLLAAGWSARDLVVVERYPARAQEVQERHGVRAVDARDAVEFATTVVFAVKPQELGAVLDELAPAIDASTLVVSIAAGITTSFIEDRLAPGVPVVRVMSNTPMVVGEAMSVVCPGAHAGEDTLARAEALLRPVGRVLRLPESQLDAVTALSGSGPAYVFVVAEAMIEAGVLLGLPRPVATELAVQTLVGSSAMLRDSGQHPALLREAVTSPAGTTIAALRELERHGIRAAFLDALAAAADRSAALGGPKR